MAVKAKTRKATCKLCGKTFRRATSAELIKAIHAHYMKAHPEAMKRRIKKGMKKARQSGGVTVGNPISWNWIGFAEKPLIEKVTGRPYEEVKGQVLDFFVSALLGGIGKPKA